MPTSGFPIRRPRRLRHPARLRDALADVRVVPDDLVLPIFVTDGDQPEPIASMPGVDRLPIDHAIQAIDRLSRQGLRQFILFGITGPQHKDAHGSYACDDTAPVNQTLRRVREAGLDVLMYADLCLCEYTDHGHCGVLCDDNPHQTVHNDRTLELLARVSQVLARCGADVVAPSGMMDGQVHAIRTALDTAGHEHVAILAYSVKYASDLYGPFRDAAGGGMRFGDRRGYQMDYRRRREWRVELEQDLAQGADMVMVKPALAYLDILHQVRAACDVPVAAYQVSGEYAMLQAAAQHGWLELEPAVLETVHAIKRAGADLILTYFAPQLLHWL